MAKILLIEDDEKLRTPLSVWLKREQYVVEAVPTAGEGLDLISSFEYDLVILDWELPDLTGIQVCKKLRDAGSSVPILMLTGRAAIDDKETGLDVGCDDYLTKPFEFRELGARLRALLRRPSAFTGVTLRAGNITLQPELKLVTRDGAEVDLSKLEYALLEFLMRRSGQVFSPEELLNSVWSADSDASIDTVRTYIKTLRKKLSNNAGNSIIRTVFGVGYKVVDTTDG